MPLILRVYSFSLSELLLCICLQFRQCTRTSGSSVLMEGWHWEQSSILHSGSHLRVPATASRCEAVGFLRYIERVSPTRAAALVFACRRALNASLHALSRVEIERGVTYGVFRVLLGTGRALPSRKEVQALDSRSTVALSAFEVLATCVAVLCSSARICHSDRVAVFVRVDSVPLASSSLPLHHSLSVFSFGRQHLPDRALCWSFTSEFFQWATHSMIRGCPSTCRSSPVFKFDGSGMYSAVRIP